MSVLAADIFLGIDENENMSIFDDGLNAITLLASLATLGAGGLAIRGIKGGSKLNSLLSKLGNALGPKTTNEILKLVDNIRRTLNEVSLSKVYNFGVDIVNLYLMVILGVWLSIW